MFDIKPAKRIDAAEFKFRKLSPDPAKPIALHVRHLGARNKPYANAVFKRKPLGEMDGYDYLIADRERDLQDLAAFCVVSWDNVSKAGKPVECTPDEVLKFFAFAIDKGYDEEIDALRAFAKSSGSFREEVVSGEDLGKE